MTDERDDMDQDTEQAPAKQERPRGVCSGDRCGFEYQLTAKGMIRKHMARVGPGLCDGAGKPPKDATGGATEDGEEVMATPPLEQFTAPDLPPSVTAPIPVTKAAPQSEQFTDPTPVAIPDEPVSGQPEPERDRWGRYVLNLGGPKKVGVTRATTFAKSYSDTFSLSEWGNRMVVRGLTLRPDLVALAHGLEVKRDKDALNSIAEQAKEAAGQKVAANLGTAIHSFTERLDAGVMTQAEVPQPYQYHTSLYAARVAEAGLTTRPQWIERTTSVLVQGERPGVQEQVAGTLDRIFRLPSGELVIGDLKTGANLEYGWGEIAVQLALYAHGVNERGLYDHRTKSWQPPMDTVREDFAIVMHLPADPTDGGKHPGREAFCELYYVDLTIGWADASLCADVRSRRKAKGHARPLLKEDIAPRPTPGTPPSMMDFARAQFSSVTSMDQAAQLYQQAADSGQFTDQELVELADIGSNALKMART